MLSIISSLSVPRFSPTLVKAICIQESHVELPPKDIMTSNNPGDWGDGKLKGGYGMKKYQAQKWTSARSK